MAKKVSKKGKGAYATYAGENRAMVNKVRRVTRHLKNHPNDTQTTVAGLNPTAKKAPRTKGNFPDQKTYWYDGAGHKILMPTFAPTFKAVK